MLSTRLLKRSIAKRLLCQNIFFSGPQKAKTARLLSTPNILLNPIPNYHKDKLESLTHFMIHGSVQLKDNTLLKQLLKIAVYVLFINFALKSYRYSESNSALLRLQLANWIHVTFTAASIFIGYQFRHNKNFVAAVLLSLLFGVIYATQVPGPISNDMKFYFENHLEESDLLYRAGCLLMFAPIFMTGSAFAYHFSASYFSVACVNLLLSHVCSSPEYFFLSFFTIITPALAVPFILISRTHPMSIYTVPFRIGAYLLFIAGSKSSYNNFYYFTKACNYPNNKISFLCFFKELSRMDNFWQSQFTFIYYLLEMRKQPVPFTAYLPVRSEDYHPEMHVTMEEDREVYLSRYNKFLNPKNS